MDLQPRMEKAMPWIGLGVLVCLMALASLLYNENRITSEIAENCGWEDEDFRCMCQKSDVIQIENIIRNNFSGIDNVELVS